MFVLLMIAGAAVVAACVGVVDTKGYVACHGDRFATNDSCTSCIETSCCGELGACSDDTCAASAGDFYRCVADGGERFTAENERTCPGAGTLPAKAVYDCSKSRCAADCQLSSCRIDPVIPYQGAACDDCLVGRCCNELNACFQDRACKLALDCGRQCTFGGGNGGGQLEGGLPDGGGPESAQLEDMADAACRGVPIPVGVGTQCTDDCLAMHRASDCTALSIFACINRYCPPGCLALVVTGSVDSGSADASDAGR